MATTRVVKYKCLFCDNRYTRQDLVSHIEETHPDDVPEGFTPFRLVFNYVNKKPLSYHGKCTECGGPTPWDENKGRYDRQCEKKACKESYIRKFEENMMRTRGVTRISKTEEGLKKMLANRKISGKYKFQDGVEKEYCGSYEHKALEFMDKVLNIKSSDILCPGPCLEYSYEGETRIYITDFYYQPYNLIIEVKDGGDNPNKRNMPEYRAKQIAKEQYIIKHTNYNYLRLTNNDFSQLLNIFFHLKMQMVENTGERVIHINESIIHKPITDSMIGSPYFVYGKNKVANCCVKIKGFELPFRAKSTMIPIRKTKNGIEVYAKVKDDKDIHIFPGGGWDPNEDPMDAAIRETKEEAKFVVTGATYCGELIEYSKNIAKWVKENIPKDQWWAGYYSKIYVGIYKSKYTGKVDEVDQDPEMASGKWYPYEEILDYMVPEYKDALNRYLGKTKESPINEHMNALMSGKVVGMRDSDAYIVNYYQKPTFDNSEVKFGVSDNINFDNIIGPNKDNNLVVLNKEDVVPINLFRLDLSKKEISEKLESYIGSEVSNNFVYEKLLDKKMYTEDQIYVDENAHLTFSEQSLEMINYINLKNYYNL